MKKADLLTKHIGKPAMLEQTAEECTELAKACLKYARFLRGENPTPKNLEEILDNLAEEIADVEICLDEIDVDMQLKEYYKDFKIKRIRQRFEKEDNKYVPFPIDFDFSE